MSLSLANRRAFSLIELVIVVVIIGIIAAIAIPRMSRGAQGAGDSALSGSLSTLRKAIDLYAAEHDGAYPAIADFTDAMTKFSDAGGTKFLDAKDPAQGVIYGPYLRSIPVMNAGKFKGKNEVTASAGEDGGWVYDATSGTIRADAESAEMDGSGTKKLVDY